MHTHNIIFKSNKKSIYKNNLILNLPFIGLNNPPMGPAIIQAIAKQSGVDSDFVDLNLELQTQLEHNPLKHGIFYEWCGKIRSELTAKEESFLNDFISPYLLTLSKYDLLSISIFSFQSHEFARWFLGKCRSVYSGKIIVGGAGIGNDNFGQTLLDDNLIDYYVVGEGELAWQAIAQDNLPWPGVNGVPHENLGSFDYVPLPDYTGFEIDKYYNSKSYGRTIGVEGSRGCVRNCTFCDIRSFWEKYKFKDGTRLANELITFKQQNQIEHFFFNDSLINGSDRAFRDFISVLAEYNKKTDDKIKWSAYYIIKSAQVYKEQDWVNLRDSGAQSLFIGIESGSEKVRDHMGKKFSDSDIEFAMEKLQRYGIRTTWLLIIGYPTETREDFDLTLDMLRKYQPMGLDRTIDTVALGFTLSILKGSPLWDMQHELDIQSEVPGHNGDVYWKTDSNSFRTRLAWRIEAEKLIRELGYNSWVGDNSAVEWFEQVLNDIDQGRVSDLDLAGYHG